MLNFGYVFAFQYCCTGNFLVSEGTPLFANFNVFVVWALRLESHYASPDLLFLAFFSSLGFPCFFSLFKAFLSFFERSSLLSQGFLGFDKDKRSLLFCCFPCLSFNKKSEEGQSGRPIPGGIVGAKLQPSTGQMLAPKVQEFYLVLGRWSGGRLVWHFQSGVLYLS